MRADVNGNRDEIYGMLAELFIQPADERTVASLLGDDADLDMDVLAGDFTDLLRGLRPFSPPPPYESLYREGVIHGRATSEVMEIYARYGVEPTTMLGGEMPDHISLELDFMRHLCTLEGGSTSDDEMRSLLEAEEMFLDEHLTRWVGNLQARIERDDRTGFYTQVAAFTNDWVTEDHQRVIGRLESMEGGP